MPWHFAAASGEGFYRLNAATAPAGDRMWSRLLDGLSNGESSAIDSVLDALKRYVPGDTPFHSEHFRQMDFCCKMKLVYLKETFGDRTFVFERALSVWKSAVAAVESADAKIDLALARQDEVRLSVNRIDARDKRERRKGRMRFPVALQDYAASIWEKAQSNPEAKRLAADGCRLRREQAFQYYSRELIAAGIPDAATFVAILNARSDRLYRASQKRLAAQRARGI